MDILHFLKREDSFPTMDKLNKWMDELEAKFTDNTFIPMQKVEYLFSYVMSFIEYATKIDNREQVIRCIMFFKKVQDLLLLPHHAQHFVKYSTPVFDVIIGDNIPFFTKRELLKLYYISAKQLNLRSRRIIAASLPNSYLLKMIDVISSFDDYDFQVLLLDTIFLLYGKQALNKRLDELIPESEELSQRFVKITEETFSDDVRIFLSYVNVASGKIFSLLCSEVLLGDVRCYETVTKTDEIWININTVDRIISWNCSSTCFSSKLTDSDLVQYDSIILMMADIENLQVQGEDQSNVSMIMNLSKPCISTVANCQPFVDKAKLLRISAKVSEQSQILISNILPKLLGIGVSVGNTQEVNIGKKFSRQSTTYKPLKISIVRKSDAQSNYSTMSWKLFDPISLSNSRAESVSGPNTSRATSDSGHGVKNVARKIHISKFKDTLGSESSDKRSLDIFETAQDDIPLEPSVSIDLRNIHNNLEQAQILSERYNHSTSVKISKHKPLRTYSRISKPLENCSTKVMENILEESDQNGDNDYLNEITSPENYNTGLGHDNQSPDDLLSLKVNIFEDVLRPAENFANIQNQSTITHRKISRCILTKNAELEFKNMLNNNLKRKTLELKKGQSLKNIDIIHTEEDNSKLMNRKVLNYPIDISSVVNPAEPSNKAQCQNTDVSQDNVSESIQNKITNGKLDETKCLEISPNDEDNMKLPNNTNQVINHSKNISTSQPLSKVVLKDVTNQAQTKSNMVRNQTTGNNQVYDIKTMKSKSAPRPNELKIVDSAANIIETETVKNFGKNNGCLSVSKSTKRSIMSKSTSNSLQRNSSSKELNIIARNDGIKDFVNSGSHHKKGSSDKQITSKPRHTNQLIQGEEQSLEQPKTNSEPIPDPESKLTSNEKNNNVGLKSLGYRNVSDKSSGKVIKISGPIPRTCISTRKKKNINYSEKFDDVESSDKLRMPKKTKKKCEQMDDMVKTINSMFESFGKANDTNLENRENDPNINASDPEANMKSLRNTFCLNQENITNYDVNVPSSINSSDQNSANQVFKILTSTNTMSENHYGADKSVDMLTFQTQNAHCVLTADNIVSRANSENILIQSSVQIDTLNNCCDIEYMKDMLEDKEINCNHCQENQKEDCPKNQKDNLLSDFLIRSPENSQAKNITEEHSDTQINKEGKELANKVLQVIINRNTFVESSIQSVMCVDNGGQEKEFVDASCHDSIFEKAECSDELLVHKEQHSANLNNNCSSNNENENICQIGLCLNKPDTLNNDEDNVILMTHLHTESNILATPNKEISVFHNGIPATSIEEMNNNVIFADDQRATKMPMATIISPPPRSPTLEKQNTPVSVTARIHNSPYKSVDVIEDFSSNLLERNELNNELDPPISSSKSVALVELNQTDLAVLSRRKDCLKNKENLDQSIIASNQTFSTNTSARKRRRLYDPDNYVSHITGTEFAEVPGKSELKANMELQNVIASLNVKSAEKEPLENSLSKIESISNINANNVEDIHTNQQQNHKESRKLMSAISRDVPIKRSLFPDEILSQRKHKNVHNKISKRPRTTKNVLSSAFEKYLESSGENDIATEEKHKKQTFKRNSKRRSSKDISPMRKILKEDISLFEPKSILKEKLEKIKIISNIALNKHVGHTKHDSNVYGSPGDVTYLPSKANCISSRISSRLRESHINNKAIVSHSAPDWQCTAIRNGEFVTVKSSDYRGKYLIMYFFQLKIDYFHLDLPEDVLELNERIDQFHQREASVVVCPINLPCSSSMWFENKKNSLRIDLLAESAQKICSSYNIYYHNCGIYGRSIFIVDPKGIMVWNSTSAIPLSSDINSILQALECLQNAAKETNSP